MQAKANVNARDKKNESPLDLALKKKQVSIVTVLIGCSKPDATRYIYYSVATVVPTASFVLISMNE